MCFWLWLHWKVTLARLFPHEMCVCVCSRHFEQILFCNSSWFVIISILSLQSWTLFRKLVGLRTKHLWTTRRRCQKTCFIQTTIQRLDSDSWPLFAHGHRSRRQTAKTQPAEHTLRNMLKSAFAKLWRKWPPKSFIFSLKKNALCRKLRSKKQRKRPPNKKKTEKKTKPHDQTNWQSQQTKPKERTPKKTHERDHVQNPKNIYETINDHHANESAKPTEKPRTNRTKTLADRLRMVTFPRVLPRRSKS